MEQEELELLRRRQEALFRADHGYDWPDCSVVECEYKACVAEGSTMCYRHTHGLPYIKPADYFDYVP